MKNLILSTAILFLSLGAIAQHAFVDAQELFNKDLTDLANDKAVIKVYDAPQDVLKVLRPYISDQAFVALMRDGVSKDEISSRLSAELKGNPFLAIPGTVEGDETFDLGSLARQGGKALGMVSGLNVTTIADGIAKFLVTRTKEELNIAFFSKFKDAINNQKELGMLFPETKSILLAIGDEVYNYNVYINALRNAFETDLKNILINAEKLVDSGTLKYLQSHPELKAIVHEGLLIVNALTKGKHPGDILDDIASGAKHKANLDILHPDAHPSAKLGNHISQSLRAPGDTYWVDAQEVGNTFTQGDREYTYLYLGLLYQVIKKEDPNLQMPFYGNNTQPKVLDWMKDMKGSADEITGYARSFAATAEALEKSVAAFNEAGAKKDFQAYADVHQNINNLLEQALNLNDLPGVNVPGDVQKDIKRLFDISGLAESIAIAIREKQYTTAVIKTAMLLDTIAGRDFADSTKFIKYATFMAAMVEADSSDQVAQIIESFALPVGSYRIKRYSNSSIQVQAYVGFAGGMEQTLESGLGNQWAPTYSLFSPIGFELSRGSRKLRKGHGKERKGSSNGLFLSVIDLGAITAYRFQNNDSTYAEEIPEVKLGQIISPGLFYTHGFARIPLTWGLGAQFMPQLRAIKDPTDAVINTSDAWRAVAFIAVDIPVLSLMVKEARNKNKSKKQGSSSRS